MHNSQDGNSLPTRMPNPDAHGQAAMLLVESLIHGLIADSHISVTTAVEIVDLAADVSRNMQEELGEASATIPRSTMLLEAISKSLSRDLPL